MVEMRKYVVIIFLMLGGWTAWSLARQPVIVDASATAPRIIIAQIKVTSSGGQFITLYNNTDSPLDLSKAQLQYFNNYDLASATSGKLISLTGSVPPRGYAVVDDGPLQACYQTTVNSVSLGMSTTADFVQAAHFLDGPGPQIVSVLDDYVNWSKADSKGGRPVGVPGSVPLLPAANNMFLQRQAPGGQAGYSAIGIPGDGSWVPVTQPDGSQPCGAAAGGIAGGSALKAGAAPIPFTAGSPSALSSIPADDNGLAAPEISEVLPNPAPPQTDADDEFVELYNSNAKPFDLSGFILQAGTTTVHKYTFPAGTSLEPNSFSAFYPSDTNFSLSNSDGQVKFLDPAGNLLSQTDEYTKAKDGYAWLSTDGLWQWTTTPTPNAANILTPPKPASADKTSSASVRSARTAKSATAAGSSNSSSGGGSAVSLHPLILAGIGTLAVVYALYEYRNDLANQLYRFRRYRAARRTAG